MSQKYQLQQLQPTAVVVELINDNYNDFKRFKVFENFC